MAYVDSELSAQQWAAFDAHLNECADCSAYLKTHKEAVRLGKAAFADGSADARHQAPKELIAASRAAGDQHG